MSLYCSEWVGVINQLANGHIGEKQLHDKLTVLRPI